MKHSPPGLHKLLRLIGRRPPVTTYPDISEDLSSFDEAVVLAHKPNEEQWQVGLVKSGQRTEFFPISLNSQRDMFRVLRREKLARETDDKKVLDLGLKSSLLALFERAQATHDRARRIIARYDETEARAEAVSNRTRQILKELGR